MKEITLPRLRNQQLQTLTDSSINICKDITEITPERQKVETLFGQLKMGIQKEQAIGIDKRAFDNSRDNFIRGFFNNLEAELAFPHTQEAVLEGLSNINTVANKYGKQMTSLSYDEETAAVDNLLEDIEALDLQVLDGNSVMRWIPVIKTSNSDFKQISKEFIQKGTAADQIESASALAPVLVKALEDMYAKLNAHIVISDNESLKTTYLELSNLVDSYR
jgi:hypothetical protein